MRTDTEIAVIAKALRTKGVKDDLCDAIAAHVQAVLFYTRKRETDVAALATKKAELIKRHQAELADLDGSLNNLRSECGHPVTRFHPDPSGGSDSSTTCDICGAEL